MSAECATSDAEFRRALSLAAHDALSNTPEPTPLALDALRLLLLRLARPTPFSVEEERQWLSRLLLAGWELTAPFDPERWKPLAHGRS
jgi:hypothetical protein